MSESQMKVKGMFSCCGINQGKLWSGQKEKRQKLNSDAEL
jgi:hypothetical protein